MENNYFKGQVKVGWFSAYVVEVCRLILPDYKEENLRKMYHLLQGLLISFCSILEEEYVKQ